MFYFMVAEYTVVNLFGAGLLSECENGTYLFVRVPSTRRQRSDLFDLGVKWPSGWPRKLIGSNTQAETALSCSVDFTCCFVSRFIDAVRFNDKNAFSCITVRGFACR